MAGISTMVPQLPPAELSAHLRATANHTHHAAFRRSASCSSLLPLRILAAPPAAAAAQALPLSTGSLQGRQQHQCDPSRIGFVQGGPSSAPAESEAGAAGCRDAAPGRPKVQIRETEVQTVAFSCLQVSLPEKEAAGPGAAAGQAGNQVHQSCRLMQLLLTGMDQPMWVCIAALVAPCLFSPFSCS